MAIMPYETDLAKSKTPPEVPRFHPACALPAAGLATP